MGSTTNFIEPLLNVDFPLTWIYNSENTKKSLTGKVTIEISSSEPGW